MTAVDLLSSSLRKRSGVKAVQYAIGFLMVVGVAIGLRSFGVVNAAEDAEYRLLRTSEGQLSADDPLTRTLFDIVFPGYWPLIDRLKPALGERNAFAEMHVLLDDDRRVKVVIPQNLPFTLASLEAPDVLILGTSRAREGIRPDTLREELGVDRVLNFSISAASFRTIELAVDELTGRMARKASLLIVSVDDVSFRQKSAKDIGMRAFFSTLDRPHTAPGALRIWERKLFGWFPQVPYATPGSLAKLERFEACADASVKQLLEGGQPPQQEEFAELPVPEQIEALRRVIEKSSALAERVVYLKMPVSPYYEGQRSKFGNAVADAVKETLGEGLIDRGIADWGLSGWSFAGSTTQSRCSADGHHLNPQAAQVFTRALASWLRADRS